MSRFDRVGAEKMAKKSAEPSSAPKQATPTNANQASRKDVANNSNNGKENTKGGPTVSTTRAPAKAGVHFAPSAQIMDEEKEVNDYDFGGGNNSHNNSTDFQSRSSISADSSVSSGSGDGSGDGDAMSYSSGSSASSMTRIRKSGLPCGLSFTTIMMVLIAIPIAFLVAYTAIPTASAVAAQTVLNNHKSVILDLIAIGGSFQEERGTNSEYLAADANSPEAEIAAKKSAVFRQVAADRMRIMMSKMQDSDLEYRTEFILDAQHQLQAISALRTQIDFRTITGPAMRASMLNVLDDFYSLFLWIAKDTRVQPLESRLIVFTILRRIRNEFGILRSIIIGILDDDGYYDANQQAVYAMASSYHRDMKIAMKSGKSEVVTSLGAWEKQPDCLLFWEQVAAVQTGNASLFPPVRAVIDSSVSCLGLFSGPDKAITQVIVDGAILNAVALAEGMKMLGAVLSCLIATGLVIYYNNREQARLEKALDATTILTAAVRRFVPTNQLKSMGARSITHVTSGMCVEIATSVIFSDIRDFSKLASGFDRLSLFEWLQNYVERMTDVVQTENAYIANFLGDGLMIIAPQPTNAVRASQKMLVSVDQLNAELISQGSQNPVTVGVGINHDILVAGCFGNENRITCSFIASGVNHASRIENLTKSFGARILASQAVIDGISESIFAYRCVGQIVVAGALRPDNVYDIFSCDELAVKEYKQETKELFEEAVKLAETDSDAALEIFERLQLYASSRSIVDKAVTCRRTGARIDRSNASSNSRSQDLGGTPRSPDRCGSPNKAGPSFSPGVLAFNKEGVVQGDEENIVDEPNRSSGNNNNNNNSSNNNRFFGEDSINVNDVASNHNNNSFTAAVARRQKLDAFFEGLMNKNVENGSAFAFRNQRGSSAANASNNEDSANFRQSPLLPGQPH